MIPMPGSMMEPDFNKYLREISEYLQKLAE